MPKYHTAPAQEITVNNIDPNLALGKTKKQALLIRELKGYWEKNIWLRDDLPCGRYTNRNAVLSRNLIAFNKSFLPSGILAELKWVVKGKLEDKDWSINYLYGVGGVRVGHIVSFLGSLKTIDNSLMDKSYSELKKGIRLWLKKKGMLRERSNCKHSGLNTKGKTEYTFKNDEIVSMLSCIYGALQKYYDERPMMERDVWDVSELSSNGYNHTKQSVRIAEIEPPWLKRAAKEYAMLRCVTDSPSTISNKVLSIKHFAEFVDKYKRNKKAIVSEQFDRKLIVEWLIHIKKVGFSNSVHRGHIGTIRQFLELCQINDWLPISKDVHFIHPGDFPKQVKPLPRYIPDSVHVQVDKHIDKIKYSFDLSLKIMRETGRRISEIITLNRDCLLLDSEGDFFLKHYQFKMKKEDAIPISKELAESITKRISKLEQERDSTNWLFPSTRNIGEHLSAAAVNANIKVWAKNNNIHDEKGNYFNFQSHQFRHTIGTDMVNRGVPFISVMRFLGHETPLMTMKYAILHDKTLNDTINKLRDDREITIAGKVVNNPYYNIDNKDLQELKKQILEQSLPNGRCALPSKIIACPHANACLDCAHFRTSQKYLPVHLKQLKETKRTLSIAKKNGMKRVVERNERVCNNLSKIIKTLKSEDNK